MRLGRKIKFNMIIAILLCMAFVVNIGATLAATTYSLFVNSSVDATNKETYIEYANASGDTGKYYYSTGSYNNQLNIMYGFSSEYDLMVEFSATYTKTTHKANDFSLNFVDRDNWCVDMNIVTSPELADESGTGTHTNTFYGLTSTSNTISGVMYYMGKLSGTGTLPVISGVTFYTSPDNSYELIGDELTVSITPRYIKAKSGNYNTATHAFKDYLLGASNTAFTNWISYKSGANAQNDDPIVMKYNAYVNMDSALYYPADYNWTANGFNLVGQDAPIYSNTAYRYSVSYDPTLKTDGSGEYEYKRNREYSSVIAGNKYYGGAGVYLIPGSDTINPVDITISYAWQKNNVVDNVATNMVRIIEDDNWSDDIAIVGAEHYSIMSISKPVYIDILDYIMLTAESPYITLLQQGYGLVITNITATQVATSPSGWASKSKDNYQVINSTEQSPALVRVQDVSSSEKVVPANVAVFNDGDSDMLISQFSVKAKLWHSEYTSGKDGNGDEVVSAWNQRLLNDVGTAGGNGTTYNYMPQIDSEIYNNYNSDLWTLNNTTYLNEDKIAGMDTVQFDFVAVSGTEVCIAPGYGIKLIDSLLIPTQYYPKASDFEAIKDSDDGHGNTLYTPIEVYDMWCSVEVDVTTSASPSYPAISSYAGVETTTNGYYNFVDSGNSIDIYATNNSNQNITSITLSSLVLATVNTDANNQLMDRDRINETQNFGFNITFIDGTSATYYTNGGDDKIFTSTTCTVNIKPNDTILLCKITDIKDNDHANYIISKYNVTATVEANKETSAVDLIKNISTAEAGLVNDGEDYYEFRIVVPASNSATVVNYNNDSAKSDFVLNTVGSTNYYYYKGVICPGQYIRILEGLTTTNGIEVELFKHVANGDATYYVASNYTAWSNVSAEWLTAMQQIYSAPNFEA